MKILEYSVERSIYGCRGKEKFHSFRILTQKNVKHHLFIMNELIDYLNNSLSAYNRGRALTTLAVFSHKNSDMIVRECL